MKFEWDENKNLANIKKHGVSFDEAKEIFDDQFAISRLDTRFEYGEERWFSIGRTKNQIITTVAHLVFDENLNVVIRIISAIKSTAKEIEQYA